MMDVRESLIKICDTDFGYVDEVPAEKFADYLLANDVTLVKHGIWTLNVDNYDCEYITCSCCNEDFYPSDGYAFDEILKYCPNCGARMDGDT